MLMTAAVTAGVMHAWAKDHGGLAASPRVSACFASIIACTIATCTAVHSRLSRSLAGPTGKAHTSVGSPASAGA
eukprot:203433-Pleurochrysis_carterae.AAC.1